MLRNLSVILLLICPCLCFAQLSKGEGAMMTVPGKTMRCYLPQHFKLQSEPPGVIHKESGTFVIAVKVPAEKRASVQHGLSRSFFEDPRYQIVSLTEEKAVAQGKFYTMLYTMNGYEFERKTMLVQFGVEQYLIIGNYSTKFKDQVEDEVNKVMANFVIR